jgi:Trk K+ transport system NAD-binding subunit
VVSITRRGGAFVPDPTTVLVEGDVVRVTVAATDARDRLDALLAEEAGREAAGREVAG